MLLWGIIFYLCMLSAFLHELLIPSARSLKMRLILVCRVKVFLVVTCVLKWAIIGRQGQPRNAMTTAWQRHTGGDKADMQTCHQSSHTAISSGLRPVRFGTFSYPAEMHMSNLSRVVYSGFSISLERISQLLSGGNVKFFPTSWHFTREHVQVRVRDAHDTRAKRHLVSIKWLLNANATSLWQQAIAFMYWYWWVYLQKKDTQAYPHSSWNELRTMWKYHHTFLSLKLQPYSLTNEP